MVSDDDTPLEVKQAAESAQRWIEEWARFQKIDLATLTLGQKFALSMKVPCVVRCWQVGEAITLQVGETCPECGKKYELSLWERLTGEDAL